MEVETVSELRAAKDAVRTFWQFRHDLADSVMIAETVAEIRDTMAEARAQGRKATAEEWIALAEMVDDACDDDGLPRLFRPQSEDHGVWS